MRPLPSPDNSLMNALNSPRIQFLPFRQAETTPYGQKAVARPAPSSDQKKYGNVSRYATHQSPTVIILRGDGHDRLGGDRHDRLGGDGHDRLGAGVRSLFATAGLGYHPDLADMRDI